MSGLPLGPLLSPGHGGSSEEPAINSVASALVNVAGAASRTLSDILLLFGIGAMVAGLLIIWFRRHPLAPVIFFPPFVLLICLLGLTAEVALQDYLSSASIAAVIERNSDPNTLIISKGDISNRTVSFSISIGSCIGWMAILTRNTPLADTELNLIFTSRKRMSRQLGIAPARSVSLLITSRSALWLKIFGWMPTRCTY